MKFVATKKCLTKKFFFTPLFFYLFLDPGSEIRDPGSGMGKNQDPGSGINIPDPQHCLLEEMCGTVQIQPAKTNCFNSL